MTEQKSLAGSQPRHALKIVSAEEWRQTVSDGVFQGSPVDHADGFIHLSSVDQVEETATRHFAGRDGLMLLVIELARVDGEVRWETSRGGDLFPHVYGTLPLECVLAAEALERDRDGLFIFPPLPRD